VLVRPGEHRLYCRSWVTAGVQQVEALLFVRQLVNELAEACGGSACGKLGGHPQGQRQPCTEFSQPGSLVRLGCYPVSNQSREQNKGISLGQQV